MGNSTLVTFTGKKINPFDLKCEDISIHDIAIGLSQKCRFNGQLSLNKFYSVAQHSTLISEQILMETGSNMLAITALLHDACEAISPLGDVPSPAKDSISVFAFGKNMNIREYEDKVNEIILEALDLKDCKHYLKDTKLKSWDKKMCQIERNELRCANLDIDTDIKINPWSRSRSYLEFMKLYESLQASIRSYRRVQL